MGAQSSSLAEEGPLAGRGWTLLSAGTAGRGWRYSDSLAWVRVSAPRLPAPG